MRKHRDIKKESPTQRDARKINQVNFVLCGMAKNIEKQQAELSRLGLAVASFKMSLALDNVRDSIEFISLERKQGKS